MSRARTQPGHDTIRVVAAKKKTAPVDPERAAKIERARSIKPWTRGEVHDELEIEILAGVEIDVRVHGKPLDLSVRSHRRLIHALAKRAETWEEERGQVTGARLWVFSMGRPREARMSNAGARMMATLWAKCFRRDFCEPDGTVSASRAAMFLMAIECRERDEVQLEADISASLARSPLSPNDGEEAIAVRLLEFAGWTPKHARNAILAPADMKAKRDARRQRG